MTREEKREKIRIRAIQEAEYIIYYNASSRQTALEFNVSHTTVLRDMHNLKDFDYVLYLRMMKILKNHKRHYHCKKAKVYNGVHIRGTRKGKVLKYEWFMRLNDPIEAFVKKLSVNRFEVTIPIEKYAGVTEDYINEQYSEKLQKYIGLENNNKEDK